MSNVTVVKKLPLKSHYIRDFIIFPEVFFGEISNSVMWVLIGRRGFKLTQKMETFYIEREDFVHELNKLDSKNKEYLVKRCPILVRLKDFKCPAHVREAAALELL